MNDSDADKWYHPVKQFRRGPDWLPYRKNIPDAEYISPTYMFLIWAEGIAWKILTPQGQFVLAACLPIGFFALLLTRSPAFLLFLMLTFLFLADLILKLFFPRRIRVERQVPLRVVQNVPFEVKTTLQNDSFLPAYDVEVNSDLTRNMRHSRSIPECFHLPPHSSRTIRQIFVVKRRGIYELPKAAAESLFPFHLIKCARHGGCRKELICHPPWQQFQNLQLPQGAMIHNMSTNSVSSAGESLDFLGCREYRPGDDPRKIHWGVSARRNRLVIKEFQEERISTASILLDNYCPDMTADWRRLCKHLLSLKALHRNEGEQQFEAAVSLTASIARSLAVQNFAVEVFASGSEVHHFRTGRNALNFDAFLDLTASLEYSRNPNRFASLADSELNRIAESGAVFLILLRIDPESEKLYKALLKRNAALRVFTFDDCNELPVWAERLSVEEILQHRRDTL